MKEKSMNNDSFADESNILLFPSAPKRVKTFCNRTREVMQAPDLRQTPTVALKKPTLRYWHRIMYKVRKLFKVAGLLTAANQVKW